MVEEGRQKLNELMKKSMESEQKILHYENVIEKQSKQMNEMENLLRYRENMAGVLKASRDELILEKESLTRYSHEMRTVLAEVSKEGKMKDRLIKELQEKIDLRERQISKLEKEVKELEANLVMTNEKRFKLQETIGSMEKELQSTKAHVNQLADINTRYDIDRQCSNSFIHKINDEFIKIGEPDESLNKNLVDFSRQEFVIQQSIVPHEAKFAIKSDDPERPDLNSSSPSEGSLKIKITVG
ncbi:hypothetical protein NQ315_005764 [Exocentrus adspersus]|uniref:Uncharacterized protein n=1 Tax=Exocentrus adspersus TaxID=1586481 RepID=A0AAV8V7Q1_9CUCU|nr:hypothetical protein NQ315_005764 [Exocentrus adspersus]